MALAPRHFLAVMAVFIAGMSFAADDRITLVKSNEELRGKIKKDDLDGVVIDVKDQRTGQSATRQLTADQIADIQWDVSDSEFRAGVNAFNNGQYGSAAQSFNNVIGDKESLEAVRAEARPYLYYMLGESLCRGGRHADGLKTLEKFSTDYKTSRYVPMAIGTMIESLVWTKDFAKATPLLAQLRTLSNESKGQADYLEGQILVAQGKTKDAESKFSSTSAGSAPMLVKLQAVIGLGQCALAENNFTKARDQAQKALDGAGKVYKDNIPPALAANAYLVMGDAHAAEATGGKLAGEQMQNKLLDAVLSYMRVTLQYAGDPRTEPAAYFKAGECFQRLSKMPNRGGDRQRAIDQYNKLTSKYQTSPWARKAEENLKNFK